MLKNGFISLVSKIDILQKIIRNQSYSGIPPILFPRHLFSLVLLQRTISFKEKYLPVAAVINVLKAMLKIYLKKIRCFFCGWLQTTEI